MDVQTCIDTYGRLAEAVFEPKFNSSLLQKAFKALNDIRVKAAFSSERLVEEIKKIVEENTTDNNKDADFYDPENPCKVYECQRQ
jgi:hypothetical protein